MFFAGVLIKRIVLSEEMAKIPSSTSFSIIVFHLTVLLFLVVQVQAVLFHFWARKTAPMMPTLSPIINEKTIIFCPSLT